MKSHFLRAGLLSLFLSPFMSSQTTLNVSLSESTILALKSNPDILLAQKDIERSAARILQAGRMPNTGFSLSFDESPTNRFPTDAGERDIQLSQTMEFPGKRGTRIALAESGKSISELGLHRTISVVASRVKQSYYRSLLAGEVIRNLEFTISMVEDFLRLVTDRYQAGASTYVDVIRTKVELTRLRNELVEARRDADLRLAELNGLLGQPVDVRLVLTDSLMYDPFPFSEDSVVARYESRSSILKIAEAETRRAGSFLALAEKSYFPDFTVGVALQSRRGQYLSGGTEHFYGIHLGLSLPLWFWQGPKGEVQESRALLDASAIQLAAARRAVRQRILGAYRTVIVAEQQVRTFETSLLRDADDELRSGIAAYQNNLIDALNLFDIYRTYRATRFEHARALHNYLSAWAELEAAAELPE